MAVMAMRIISVKIFFMIVWLSSYNISIYMATKLRFFFIIQKKNCIFAVELLLLDLFFTFYDGKTASYEREYSNEGSCGGGLVVCCH